MADDAVALHLAKAQAAVTGAALDRLARQDLDGPAAARVDLVVHHVLQALVVGGPQEDLRLQLPPRVAVVHHHPAAALVAAPAPRPHSGSAWASAEATPAATVST